MEGSRKNSGLNLQRQSFLGFSSDDTLHKTRVAVIGVGGGGSHIVQQLAHVGVGFILAIDPDYIEDTNLNRVVGATVADVEQHLKKVLISKRVIEAVNANATVQAAATTWDEQVDLLQECDVIFSCIDSLIGRSELEAFARRSMIPMIDIGMDVHSMEKNYIISGQVALSIPGMPCLRCMGILTEEDMKKEAEKYGVAGFRPQVVWPNGVLASTAVGCFMQMTTPWFAEMSMPILLEYDGNKQTIQLSNKIPYLAEGCVHYADIGNLGDPFWAPLDVPKGWLLS
jgi:molybdopterin/thiamine biosynthesis adenylyltransferase